MKQSRKFSILTFLFMGISTLGYVISQLDNTFFNHFALVGYAQYDDGTWLGVADGEWYRLLTVALLHGGIFHLAFNMYALWVIGVNLENVVGRWRFATIYLLSLLGGSTASFLFNASNTPSVGASGAIFGLFGATVVVNRRRGRDASSMYSVIGINLLLGFILPNVDWHAHVGGLLLGAISSALLVAGATHKYLVGRLAGLVIVLIALSLLITHHSTTLQLGFAQ